MARSSPQSALRYPLTIILGAEANVRLLRELARHGGELAAPSLVIRSGLAQSSVRDALISLEAMGIVEAAGTARARLYLVRRKHPLAAALKLLFQAEEDRFNAILDAVRAAAERCGDGIVAVWIYGSVARGEDSAASDVDIAVVAKPAALPDVETAMRGELRNTEDRLAFSASVIGVDTYDVLQFGAENDPWWATVVRHSITIVGERPDALLTRLRHRSARVPRSA